MPLPEEQHSPPLHELDTLAGGDASGPSRASGPIEIPGPEDDPDAALPRGYTLGRYLVLERLGGGGMGVVYAAYDPDLDRKVALKLVRPAATRRGLERAKERLLREAQAMAKLSHVNVVAVHDVGTVGDKVFVAMEFIDGTTLREWMREGPRPIAEVLEIFAAAGRGLAAAHARGLVHRDFKPDNVMLGNDGRVVVTDFGLAARGGPRRRRTVMPGPGMPTPAAEPDAEDTPPPDTLPPDTPPGKRASVDVLLTEIGSLVGTPAYMSPEQLTGLPADARSDQFAFCVALYEALYRERPFVGESLQSLALAVTTGRLRPEPRPTAVPRWLRRAILRGLAIDPEGRWPTVDDLLAALREQRRRRPLVWTGALVLFAGAGLGAIHVDRTRRAAACDAEGRSIEAVWNDDRRQALHRALSATAAPYAEEAHARVVARLDGWAVSWSRARTEVCRRANVEGTLDSDLHARSLACFEEQAERLAAMLGVYADGEPGMAVGAVRSAASLTQLERCDDAAALALRPLLPRDDAARDEIARIRADQARAAALADAGRYADAIALARGALEGAIALDWPPTEAESRLAAASIQAELGDYPAVQRELEHAFVRASSAGDDTLAAKAAIALLRVLAYQMGRIEEGLAWSKVAGALLVRTGRTDGLDAAALANNLGLAYEARGDLDGALAEHRRALEIRERVLGRDHPECAHSYGNLGNVHAARGEHEEALRWHTRALDVRTRALGPGHPDTARSHANLGRVHLARRDFEPAKAAFARALAVLEPSVGREHRVTARVLHHLGDTHRAGGELDTALVHYRDALAIHERVLGRDHVETARSAQGLGLAMFENREHDAALALLRRALAVRDRELGEDHPDTAATRAAIAVVCLAQARPGCASQ